MSQELFRTRCKQGTLIITDEYIRIELGSLKQSTLYRSMLTGIDSNADVYHIASCSHNDSNSYAYDHLDTATNANCPSPSDTNSKANIATALSRHQLQPLGV